ncbi:hypothetical protein [Neisseria sp. Ec49-e6-T10]|uniref:hypothetical protein n=1 Tax=Neisseria sp. Ec49-e6-T10 TaxID=3140744 RepID=UPI003EBF83A2
MINNINQQFNILSQARSVSSLLNAAIAAYELLPNGTEKDKLAENIKVFENTMVPCTWSVDNIKEISPEISIDDAHSILYGYALQSQYEIDWIGFENYVNEQSHMEN